MSDSENVNTEVVTEPSVPVPKKNSMHAIKRFGSGVLIGIAGLIISGVAVQVGLLPQTIGVIPTAGAVGSALFVVEWIQGFNE